MARVCGCYVLGVDATHVQNVASDAPGTTSQTSTAGNETHKRSVLEIKVIAWGMALSIGSEWISNDCKTEKEKQDSELAAFYRLSDQLKKEFPRLQVLLVADGLYAGAPFFSICAKNNWHFFIVLKDKKMSTLWSKVDAMLLTRDKEAVAQEANAMIWESIQAGSAKKLVEQTIEWVNRITYKDHELAWVEQKVDRQRFVHLSSIPLTHQNVRQLCAAGRNRWYIEDSFNTQKNRGQQLKHQFSRSSWIATKNFYQALQIGSILAQLVEYSRQLASIKPPKLGIQHLWQLAIAAMLCTEDNTFHTPPKRMRFLYVL